MNRPLPPQHISVRLTGPTAAALEDAKAGFIRRMGEAIKWTTPVREGSKHGDFLVYGEYLAHRNPPEA